MLLHNRHAAAAMFRLPRVCRGTLNCGTRGRNKQISLARAGSSHRPPNPNPKPKPTPDAVAPLCLHRTHTALLLPLLLQSLTFAVMPADDGAAAAEASDFLAYVTTEFPDTESHWEEYGSESEFIDIIGESDYSRDPNDNRPAFVAGIVFTSGSPDWAYTVRGRRVLGRVGATIRRFEVHTQQQLGTFHGVVCVYTKYCCVYIT